jgi:hypothetical protein
MNPSEELLESLKPIFEEDKELFRIEVLVRSSEIKLEKISGYYFRGYRDMIIAIAEIKELDINDYIRQS